MELKYAEDKEHGHEAVRVDNLMYDGCEPHWKCTKCDMCVPFHCYTKEQFEKLECPAKVELKLCPFCGREAVRSEPGWSNFFQRKLYGVHCAAIECVAGDIAPHFFKQEDADAAWNKRTYERGNK